MVISLQNEVVFSFRYIRFVIRVHREIQISKPKMFSTPDTRNYIYCSVLSELANPGIRRGS